MDATVYKYDWQNLDGVQTIDYVTSSETISPAYTKRKAITEKDMQTFPGFGIKSTDAIWAVWPKSIGEVKPRQGHELVFDNGETWAVLSAIARIVAGEVTGWKLLCRRRLETQSEL